MSFSRKTIIIDCGASRTALGIFSRHRGRPRLDRHFVEVFPAPAGPGDEWLQLTTTALPKLRARAGRGGTCVLVLPGHAVLTKFLEVPPVKSEQRQKVIRFESEQNLPVALSELVWDSVVSSEREAGLEVLLAASHLQKVEPLCAAARAAGFEPHVVLPASLASLAAFRAAQAPGARPAVVMSIGAYSTTFLMLEESRFVVRTFAFGQNASEIGDPAKDAKSAAHRLAMELLRTLLFFRQQDKWADTRQIYLTGGGARRAGLREALAERLQLPVAELNLSPALEIAPDVGNEGAVPPVLTELAGAAVTQLSDGHAVLNLLPPLRRRRIERRRRRTLAAAALFLIALPASIFWTLRPAQKPHRPMVLARSERSAAAPAVSVVAPAADAPDPEPTPETPAAEPEAPFGVELLAVKSEPYRLQLAGYLGEPDDYLAVFISPGQPGTTVARSGSRLESQSVEFKKLAVRKMPVAHEDAWPMYEVAAEATLYDETNGENIVLNDRSEKFTPPQATIRMQGGERASRVVRTGDDVREGDTVYRIDRIRVDPPEIIVTKNASDKSEPEIRVLRVTGAGSEAAEHNSSRAAAGLVATR